MRQQKSVPLTGAVAMGAIFLAVTRPPPPPPPYNPLHRVG
jgi:hypothetical protein